MCRYNVCGYDGLLSPILWEGDSLSPTFAYRKLSIDLLTVSTHFAWVSFSSPRPNLVGSLLLQTNSTLTHSLYRLSHFPFHHDKYVSCAFLLRSLLALIAKWSTRIPKRASRDGLTKHLFLFPFLFFFISFLGGKAKVDCQRGREKAMVLALFLNFFGFSGFGFRSAWKRKTYKNFVL